MVDFGNTRSSANVLVESVKYDPFRLRFWSKGAMLYNDMICKVEMKTVKREKSKGSKIGLGVGLDSPQQGIENIAQNRVVKLGWVSLGLL